MSTPEAPRVYLSPPHMSGRELERIEEAFESNWIAPLGPHVDAFEREFAAYVDAPHAVALSAGTAALHLALKLAGVGRGDRVMVSSLTFVASANPIRYEGAEPIFVDSERASWNMDPALVAEGLADLARRGELPKVLLAVHLYGQTCDLDPIMEACAEYGVTLIEDAAEALGSDYKGRPPGTFGHSGIFSFNGNKIITTSGGGMMVTNDGAMAVHARKLATQAREPESFYEHAELGYNYRLSNVLAGIGRAQIAVIEERVAARRRNFARYEEALSDLPGFSFQPEAPWGRHTRWLTCIQVDPEAFGATAEDVRLALEEHNIESRPLWKPMHLQPLYDGCEMLGGAVCEEFFDRGLCLPSGSSLADADLDRVVDVIRARCAG
ncbi:MAG: aminotransferase class I/II-fold pyridoxal phosphate-dependent enzyme [Longimicrobiales bacterium]